MSIRYLALKTGSASGVDCVLLVYLRSKPSEERPGTLSSLNKVQTYKTIFPLKTPYMSIYFIDQNIKPRNKFNSRAR